MRNEDYLEQREIELQERLPVVLEYAAPGRTP